jgi:hypothetical protein
MTLGIFGDSYTQRSGFDTPIDLQDLSWPGWLESWGITVGNHGLSGSGLWYTYGQFLEHHHRYDRVVVTVTSYHRQPIRGFPYSITSPEHLQRDIDSLSLHADQRRALRAALDHLLWAQVDGYAHRTHQLLVRDLQQLRPDALFIPCFHDHEPSEITDLSGFHYGTPKIPGWSGLTLWDISEIDHQHFALDHDKVKEEYRSCHINEQNNRQLAHEIMLWLQQLALPLQDISAYSPPLRPRSHYFKYKGEKP